MAIVAATTLFSAIADAQPIRSLAQEFVTVFESPDPARVFAYSPGIVRSDCGRLVATLDLGGPGMKDWPEPKGRRGSSLVQGKVFTSDDGGLTWTHRADFPFFHATPFAAGKSLYVLGQAADLMIIRSNDHGATWSAVAKLTVGQFWTGHAHNYRCANGCVYIPMERYTGGRIAWSELAPVLLRGRLDADLTRAENWTFASELVFRDTYLDGNQDFFGIPFFHAPYPRGSEATPGRYMAPIGWLEANVVQFTDPDHLWHDPSGKTFHLWSRAHTGGTGYACIAKVVEQGDAPGTGAMTTMLEKVPSGKTMLYAPCPGGQMKFHVLYDEQTKLYWLLSTQATDSMIRPDRMPSRFSHSSLPCDQLGQLRGDLFPGALKASQVVRR
jgi:hypothetical protein